METTRTVRQARPHAPMRTGRAAKSAPRPDRKQAILLAAERLFALRGYHGVSIRQIADAAGVQVALVGYYYGPKQALFHAIFAHWSGTIAERLALLREVEAQPWDEGKLGRIVEAFLRPVLQLRASAEGESYALLITAGLSSQRDEADLILREFFDPMAEAFIGALHATLRHEARAITRATVAWCYQFALGALSHHIADIRVARLSGGANVPNDPAAAPLLVRFIVHGIRGVVGAAAPPSASPSPKPTTKARRPSP